MERYIVLQLARFGDIVQTKRLILSLLARGEVHLCVDRGLAALAQLVYPEVHVHALSVHRPPDAEGVGLNTAAFGLLRGLRPSFVCNMNFSPGNYTVARLFPPEIVLGYPSDGGQGLRDRWVRTGFRLTSRRRATPLNLADFWANFIPDPIAPALVNPPHREAGEGLGVVLAGRESRRSLPPEALSRIVQVAFSALGGTKIYLLGSKTEQPAARRLRRLLPAALQPYIQDLSGKTDWAALADVVRGLACVLTPDTGTMHLAAHFGVPVRAFFLSSAWCHETGPYGAGHLIWQASEHCAPCLESASCSRNMRCLEPFQQDGLLRQVSLSLTDTPVPEDGGVPGLVRFRTGVDALGTFCGAVSGEDRQAAERRAVRQVLREYLGIAEESQSPPVIGGFPPAYGNHLLPQTAELAAARERLFAGRDWMLPERSFYHGK